MANLPPSCTDCLEILNPQDPGRLRTSPDLSRASFTFNYNIKISFSPVVKMSMQLTFIIRSSVVDNMSPL
jgi:hypothetical protein